MGNAECQTVPRIAGVALTKGSSVGHVGICTRNLLPDSTQPANKSPARSRDRHQKNVLANAHTDTEGEETSRGASGGGGGGGGGEGWGEYAYVKRVGWMSRPIGYGGSVWEKKKNRETAGQGSGGAAAVGREGVRGREGERERERVQGGVVPREGVRVCEGRGGGGGPGILGIRRACVL